MEKPFGDIDEIIEAHRAGRLTTEGAWLCAVALSRRQKKLFHEMLDKVQKVADLFSIK